MPKKSDGQHLYSYEGPVMIFDNIVTPRWKAQTTAPSEAKARSNLAFQWKKEYGRIAASRVTLPGKINMIN